MRIITITILFALLGLYSCDSKEQPAEKAKEDNREGLDYFEKGDYKEARRYFVKAAEHAGIPDSSKTIYYENVANAFSRDTLYDSAHSWYRKAAALYPRSVAKYYVDMAYAYFQLSQVDSALLMLEGGYRIDSNNAVINSLLGLTYLGEYDRLHFDPVKAYPYNKRARHLYMDAATKLALAKNEYHLNNPRRAEALFRQLHLEFPEDKDYLISLILIKGELEDTVDMKTLQKELKKYFPDHYEQTINDISPGTHTITWSR